MDAKKAKQLADRWFAAWNAHDLDAILALYSDEFEMTSRYIVQIAGEPSGTLKGKAAVGAYWRKALQAMPDLKLEPVEVLASVNSITLFYRNMARKELGAEVLFVDKAGKITKGLAHYADE